MESENSYVEALQSDMLLPVGIVHSPRRRLCEEIFPKLPSLSFFFPVHNEQNNVERVILQAQAVLPLVAEDWEIIPVNDGSTDDTGRIIERIAALDSRIRPVHHRKNMGYGRAIISGYNAARLQFVFFTDGDDQFDIAEITRLIGKLDDADLILGFRKNRRESWIRKTNAFLWGRLVQILFQFRVRDVDCAFKLMKREVVDAVSLTASGAMVSTELLAKAKNMGFKFAEIGVTHYPRTEGVSSGGNIFVILRAFKELFVLYPNLKS